MDEKGPYDSFENDLGGESPVEPEDVSHILPKDHEDAIQGLSPDVFDIVVMDEVEEDDDEETT